MAIYRDKWFECWFDGFDFDPVVPVYILIVTPDPQNTGQILIVDPRKNNEIVYRGRDYEDACTWLSEDEYEKIEGRVYPDDGLGHLDEFID